MSPGERRDRIRALLLAGGITTQEALREALLSQQIDVTQATLSRDLRALRARRVTRADGSAAYELPPPHEDPQAEGPTEQVVAMVDSIARNEALIVVHTAPGAASAVARAIDLSRVEGVLGSLAGDDTVFVAPLSVRQVAEVERRLLDLFER